MELISTHIVKASEIGICDNMFGGTMMGLIDGTAAAYAMQVCDTQRIVTIKVDEFLFKKAVKVGDLLKIYGKVTNFGVTSVTLYMEVRRYLFNGQEETVTQTNIKFVQVDDSGRAAPISDAVKQKHEINAHTEVVQRAEKVLREP